MRKFQPRASASNDSSFYQLLDILLVELTRTHNLRKSRLTESKLTPRPHILWNIECYQNMCINIPKFRKNLFLTNDYPNLVKEPTLKLATKMSKKLFKLFSSMLKSIKLTSLA